jgi:hypothetical protein
MKRPLKRPSPAMMVSVIALFVALAGSAYAIQKIGSKQIKKNAVTTKKIKDGAVKEAKLATGAATAGKIADGAVTGAKLGDGAVGTAKLADGAVDKAKLADSAEPMWAHVDGDNKTILSQSGGISITPGGTAGAYGMQFPRSLRNHALLATLSQPGNTEDNLNIEVIRFGSGPGEGTGLTPQDLVVHVRDPAEAFTAENFYVTAIP